ncbi:hypothetical protein SKAU_G00376500 [Synaphobranchus kaupii]|uniref:Uncharacterized protein n=1 Tax=Synaphobranchus kaupii TaxID=118154 RepID=A0A9Q1ECT5_SYNKA|nr:hypothetical protein SKAU_G00376500 [Synaphobranchus kaupii]
MAGARDLFMGSSTCSQPQRGSPSPRAQPGQTGRARPNPVSVRQFQYKEGEKQEKQGARDRKKQDRQTQRDLEQARATRTPLVQTLNREEKSPEPRRFHEPHILV